MRFRLTVFLFGFLNLFCFPGAGFGGTDDDERSCLTASRSGKAFEAAEQGAGPVPLDQGASADSPIEPSAGPMEPLKVAINAYYPPFSYYDEAGVLTGFDVDIALALCRAIGRECVLEPMAFVEILPAFLEGEVDFSVSSMGSSAERGKIVDFTGKYYSSRSIYIVRQGELTASGPEHFRNRVLCARAGTLQERYLRGKFSDISPIISTATMEDVFDMVREGDADVALVDGLSGSYLLQQDIGIGLTSLDELVTVDDDANVARVSVSKKRPGLLRRLNEAILSIRAEGAYREINRKYFAFDIY